MTKSVQKIKASEVSKAAMVKGVKVSYEIDLDCNHVALGRYENGSLKQLFLTVKEAYALVHNVARYLKREKKTYSLRVDDVTLRYEIDLSEKSIEFQRIERDEIESLSFFQEEILVLSELYNSNCDFFANENRRSKC